MALAERVASDTDHVTASYFAWLAHLFMHACPVSSCGSKTASKISLHLTSHCHDFGVVMQFLAALVTVRVRCLHATPNPLVSDVSAWPGERPDDGKRGGWRRTLRFLAAGAGLAAMALLGARYVLRARRPANETPLERARRELRDLRRRIEVRSNSVF